MGTLLSGGRREMLVEFIAGDRVTEFIINARPTGSGYANTLSGDLVKVGWEVRYKERGAREKKENRRK